MTELRKFEIPGYVTIAEGGGGLPKIVVRSGRSTAEVYLHGAHVSEFQREGEPPLLFMSKANRFQSGSPLRGGMPIIFPWFGNREGFPAHGFARTTVWNLEETLVLVDESVALRFSLPMSDPNFQVRYTVTVGRRLECELTVINAGESEVEFENCLHTYFNIGSIHTVSVEGLHGLEYLDQLRNNMAKEESTALRISEEVDRIYYDSTSMIVIQDPTFSRRVTVEKTGSRSTIVWNPWIDKSKRMPDFGNDEYPGMVCVESGNVGKNKISLPPGQKAMLKVILDSHPLA